MTDKPAGGTPGGTPGGPGILVLDFGTGGGISASTVLPPGMNPGDLTYMIVLARDGFEDIVVTEITGTSPSVEDIPPGGWNLQVTGFSGEDPVYGSGPEPVEISSGVNTVSVTLLPLTDGVGAVLVTVTWPEELVDGMNEQESFITGWGGGQPALITGQTSLTGTTLTYDNPEIDSGLYELRIELEKDGVTVVTVFDIVHVYNNQVSSKTINLTASQIASAPEAPTGLDFDVFNGDVTLTWNDQSSIEEGYRVLRRLQGGAEFELIEELPANAEGFIDNVPTGIIYEYRIVAYNVFGVSEPAEATVFVQAPPTMFGGFLPDAEFDLDSYYGVMLNWTPVTGADSLEVYLGQDPGSLELVATLGAAEIEYFVGPAQFEPNSTYVWELRAGNAGGETSSGILEFGTRGAEWWVAEFGNNLARGSQGDPVGSIGEAVSRAPNTGSVVTVGTGTYNEAVFINKDLILQGSGTNTTLRNNLSENTVTMTNGVLRDLTIEVATGAGTDRRAVYITGGSVVLENTVIVETSGGTSTTRGVEIFAGNNVIVRNNTVTMASGSTGGTTQVGIRVSNNHTGTAEVSGNRINMVSQGNLWNFGVNILARTDFFNNVIGLTGIDSGNIHRLIDIDNAGASNSLVLHNTFVNEVDNTNVTMLRVGTATGGTVSGLDVWNNVVMGLPGSNENPVQLAGGGGVERLYNNIFYNIPNGQTAVDALNANTYAEGNIYLDPSLGGGPLGGWYEPTGTTPNSLRFGGRETARVATDIDGNNRTAPVSIGPYEIDNELIDLDDGLVGFWEFLPPEEETVDSSVYGNDLTDTGTTQIIWNPVGFMGRTILPLQDVDNQLTIDASSSLTTSLNGQTVSFYFWSNDFGVQGSLLNRYLADNTTRVWGLGSQLNTNQFRIVIGNNLQADIGGFAVDDWNHVVVVFDHDSDRVRIYLNGANVHDAAAAVPLTGMNESGPYYIGRQPEGGGAAQSVLGTVAELRLYNRVLTQAEINSLGP